jgi:hypothetical protein
MQHMVSSFYESIPPRFSQVTYLVFTSKYRTHVGMGWGCGVRVRDGIFIPVRQQQ